jgi:hypothetical protein
VLLLRLPDSTAAKASRRAWTSTCRCSIQQQQDHQQGL